MFTLEIKKLLRYAGIFLICVGLFAGCSTAPLEKTNAASKSTTNEKQNEDSYIKTAIETANTIQTNIDALKPLLTEMDVNDLRWQGDTGGPFVTIKSAANVYTGAEIVLSPEQKEKYKNTNSYFSEAVTHLHSIADDGWKAVDTYDEKTLEGISARLDQASNLIKKGLEQLEIERYKE
jgi:hypothetical protein